MSECAWQQLDTVLFIGQYDQSAVHGKVWTKCCPWGGTIKVHVNDFSDT